MESQGQNLALTALYAPYSLVDTNMPVRLGLCQSAELPSLKFPLYWESRDGAFQNVLPPCYHRFAVAKSALRKVDWAKFYPSRFTHDLKLESRCLFGVTLTHSLILTFSHSHTLTLSHSHTLTRPHPHTLTLTLSHILWGRRVHMQKKHDRWFLSGGIFPLDFK